MRLFYALTFLFFLTVKTNAQPKEITLKGYLGVEGGESFSYSLVFTDSAGTLKGYSLTWLQEGKEVKALISGTIDRKNQNLVFREERILYNHGFSSRTTICLIQATLQYTSVAGKLTLSGPIYSADAGNIYCGKGSINIMGDDAIVQLFSTPARQDTIVMAPVKKPALADRKSMKIVYDTANVPVVYKEPVKGPDKITSGLEKVYDWNSDTVVIDIWDGGQVDGDIITVSYNNKPVLMKYVLTKERKQLRLPVAGQDVQVITITANNEGNDPPNTATLLLTDLDTTHPVIAYNTIGKQAVIKIRKTAK